jgi:2',3'-cyclic-nucleotide 2'-phosphodiesterase (5'-nucleotidase family)
MRRETSRAPLKADTTYSTAYWRSGKTPLLVLAGDFLSTSVASSVFQGEQMIAALNAAGLHGDAGESRIRLRRRRADSADGRSQVAMGDVRLRASETNLGDLIADVMRAAADADIAIINSGGVRGNRCSKKVR